MSDPKTEALAAADAHIEEYGVPALSTVLRVQLAVMWMEGNIAGQTEVHARAEQAFSELRAALT